MAEDWELRDLRRDLKSVELRFDALEKKERERSQQRLDWFVRIAWTIYVVLLTTLVVLSSTGYLDRH